MDWVFSTPLAVDLPNEVLEAFSCPRPLWSGGAASTAMTWGSENCSSRLTYSTTGLSGSTLATHPRGLL